MVCNKVDQATGRASGVGWKFNSQAAINTAKRGKDADVAWARTMERIGRTANIDAGCGTSRLWMSWISLFVI